MKSKVTVDMGNESKVMQFSDLEDGDLFIDLKAKVVCKKLLIDGADYSVSLRGEGRLAAYRNGDYPAGVERVDVEIKVIRK